MTASVTPRRAIGIVRVSEVKGRKGDKFASPGEQRDRINDACQRDNLELVEVVSEMDVSGRTPLDHRAGLRRAIEAVEAGEASVIVAAYFDRLMRSLRVQDELVSRVEAAGGQVLAVDVGAVTNGSAGQWLSGTMLGAVAEYHSRASAERSRDGQQQAIDRGVAPWPNVPPGYVRNDEEVFVPSDDAPTVLAAFELRDEGATIAEVRTFLSAHGIDRSYHGVSAMLKSRVYLGEIHFGSYEPNLTAHDPIVARELWQRVQRASSARGRKPKSERLLARLGVLRCASCGGRMVVGTQTQNGRSYPFYRCGHVREDCSRRVTISAELVEGIVTDEVRAALDGIEGRASAEQGAREAEHALEQAQSELDGAIRTLAGFEDETAARDRLAELRETRDDARAKVDQLGRTRSTVTLNAAADWDRLSLDARRALIRATVERVRVGPGRGASRVTVELVGE